MVRIAARPCQRRTHRLCKPRRCMCMQLIRPRSPWARYFSDLPSCLCWPIASPLVSTHLRSHARRLQNLCVSSSTFSYSQGNEVVCLGCVYLELIGSAGGNIREMAEAIRTSLESYGVAVGCRLWSPDGQSAGPCTRDSAPSISRRGADFLQLHLYDARTDTGRGWRRFSNGPAHVFA